MTTHDSSDRELQSLKQVRTLLSNMQSRCYNPKNTHYSYYGGRGIEVTERWRGRGKAQNFISDMGLPPQGMTLDRIDPNGNYEKANCRWASRSMQAHNQSATNKVKLKGVFRSGTEKRYRSWIDKDGVRHRLGSFDTAEEAHEAYMKKSKELYGE